MLFLKVTHINIERTFSVTLESCHRQKFSDDSAIVGCIMDRDESEYRELLKSFMHWCEINRLNDSTTKEIVVDFIRFPQQVVPVNRVRN